MELQVAKVEVNHENHEKSPKNDFQMLLAPWFSGKPIFFIFGMDEEFNFLFRNLKIMKYN